jgi:hypothetical protein
MSLLCEGAGHFSYRRINAWRKYRFNFFQGSATL